jgi:hypothetical protein
MEYKTNTKKIEIEKIIKFAVKDDAEIMVWSTLEKKKLIAKGKIVQYMKDTSKSIVLFKWLIDKKAAKKLSSLKKSLCVYIVNQSFIFKAVLKEENENGYFSFELPKAVTIIDRRKNPRLNCKGSSKFSAKFKVFNRIKNIDLVGTKNLLDVSKSGFSFLVNEKEGSYYYQGLKIRKLDLKVDHMLMEVNVRIVNVTKITPDIWNEIAYNKFKVSFTFDERYPQEEEDISEYIISTMIEDGYFEDLAV